MWPGTEADAASHTYTTAEADNHTYPTAASHTFAHEETVMQLRE